MATKIIKDTIKRGDNWDGGTFTCNQAGFDWTGTVVKMQWRDKPDGTIYLTQNPTCSYPSTGVMTFPVSLSGSQTGSFPKGTMFTDVQITRTSPAFGPYTPVEIQLEVQLDITQ